MLDFVFAVLFIISIMRSSYGKYSELFCNVARVIGILAGVVGMFVGAAFKGLENSGYGSFVMHLAVLIIAVFMPYAAKYLARLYNDKAEQSRRELEEYIETHSRQRGAKVYMNDEDFDNEELRFGKGGFKPFDPDERE